MPRIVSLLLMADYQANQGISCDTAQGFQAPVSSESAQEAICRLEKQNRSLFHQISWLEDLVKNSNEMISCHTLEGVYKYASPAARSLLGYEPSELVGRQAYDYFHPEDLSGIKKSHSSILASNAPYRIQYRIRTKSGEHRWVESDSHTIRDISTGEPTEIIAVTRDISRQKAAEGKAKYHQLWLRSVLDTIPVILFALDADGQIVLSDGRGLQRIGIQAHELVGQSAFDVLRDNPEALALVRKAMSGDPANDTLVIRNVPFDIWCMPGQELGYERYSVLGVALDASDRNKAEKALLRAETLTAIGTLAGGLAHQFNNVNSVVLGNLALALRDPALSPQTAERLDRAYQAVQRTSGLSRNLLAFSRPAEKSRSRVKVDILINDVLRIVRKELDHAGIEIRLDEVEPCEIVCDVGQIQHALLNIILNARDAMSDSETRILVIATTCTAEMAEISIRDTGHGIPEHIRSRIFDPLFSTRPDNDPSGQFSGGSGLGLSLSAQILNRHNGTIRVDSQDGHGSEFTIQLPIDDSAYVSESPVPVAPVLTGATVLVVDDEEEIASLLHEILEDAGCRVTACHSGEEAQQALSAARYDLLVTDLTMPGMNGFTLLKHLQSQPATERPVALVLSGRLNAADDLRVRKVGAFDLVEKPIDIESFLQTCHKALNQPKDPHSKSDGTL